MGCQLDSFPVQPVWYSPYPGKSVVNSMQDKQKKVTLYIPPELHQQLKIKAAIEAEPMSSLAERAISFYLLHSEVVDRVEAHGHTHQVYDCPSCGTSVVLRDGKLVALSDQASILPDDEELSVPAAYGSGYGTPTKGEEELVVC